MKPGYPHAVLRARLAIAVALMLVATAAATLPRAISAADGPAAGPVSFTLPVPTGPLQIGTFEMHLIDRDRIDPWAEGGGPRELMISVWYPARHSADASPAPYLPQRIASFYDQTTGELGIEKGAADFVGAVSHAQTRAPVDDAEDRRPVLLYSPGGGLSRTLGTQLVEELVSHGYIVVTVDSTYQAPVEFPDGLVMPAQGVDLKQALAERVLDIRFVLDQLELLASGGNPDVEQRGIPAGLGAVLDLDRVGMFGHSMGGFATAEAMLQDRRIDAGINLDGSMGAEYRQDPGAKLNRPFMVIGAGTDGSSQRPHTHLGAPDWKDYWSDLTGWKRDLHLPEGEHMSFTDLQSILPELSADLPLNTEAVTAAIGTIDAQQSVTTQRAYLTAFFDHHLLGLPRPILDAVPAGLPAELIS